MGAGIFTGRNQENSNMFNIQSVPVEKIQCKMPPEKK